jgi:hypothetical protein
MTTLEVISIILFSFGGFLLLLYFGWEAGPHHKSSKREILYLLFVLSLLAR